MALPEPFLIFHFQFQSLALRLDNIIAVEVSSPIRFGDFQGFGGDIPALIPPLTQG